MSQFIECIPNFSEARRSEVIDWIVAAIASVSNVNVLEDQSASTKILAELAGLEKEVNRLEKEIRAVVKERGGI